MLISIIFLTLLMGSMANPYGSIKWSPLPGPPIAENTTWSPVKHFPEQLGSGKDGSSQHPPELSPKSNLAPVDEELLFQRADKFFSKFVNTAVLNMFLQTLVEAVDSFLQKPHLSSNKGPESFDFDIFKQDSPDSGKIAQGQYRVKRNVRSFLSETISKIWDFIKNQIVFVIRFIIPSPILNLLEALMHILGEPLLKVCDLIRSLFVHILKKFFSNSDEEVDDDLNKLIHDFTKQLEELLKTSKHTK